MKQTVILIAGLAAIFLLGRWAELRIEQDGKAIMDSLRVVPASSPVRSCSDEWDRLDKLARLAASWVDTMAILRAENDSLRHVLRGDVLVPR